MPNGVHPNHWTPEKFGNDFELTRQLLPLQNLKDEILVLGELMNKNSLFKGADGHYAKSASLLTCMPIKQTIGDNISSGGVSIDQVIASKRGQRNFISLTRIWPGPDYYGVSILT